MGNKNWKKELAVDVRALGSWIFFSLVLIRYAIGPFFPSLWRVLLAGITIAVALALFKNIDGYTSRGLALSVFVSMHYQDLLFSIFATVIYLGMVSSVHYLEDDNKKLLKGIVVGLISLATGYAGGELLMNVF